MNASPFCLFSQSRFLNHHYPRHHLKHPTYHHHHLTYLRNLCTSKLRICHLLFNRIPQLYQLKLLGHLIFRLKLLKKRRKRTRNQVSYVLI